MGTRRYRTVNDWNLSGHLEHDEMTKDFMTNSSIPKSAQPSCKIMYNTLIFIHTTANLKCSVCINSGFSLFRDYTSGATAKFTGRQFPGCTSNHGHSPRSESSRGITFLWEIDYLRFMPVVGNSKHKEFVT
jgi:hypothetical protein